MLNLAAMYGNETWSATRTNKLALNIQERKFLRKVCRPVTEQGFGES
jgi:hypothetical protein